MYVEAVAHLIEALTEFPGIGRRTAERMAFHILVSEPRKATRLAQLITDIQTKVRPCSRCYNLSDRETCRICSNPKRDHSKLCVVEQPKDLLALERMGLYDGLYHVLLGTVSIAEGVGAQDLTIEALLNRVDSEGVEEVILATGPSLEGDATALTLARALTKRGIPVTRLARGLPLGSSIDGASPAILADALETRQPLQEERDARRRPRHG